MSTMILAGDIGGTKTLVALFESTGSGLRIRDDETYASRDFSSFEAILERFLAKHRGAALQAACFGVAGPVVAGKVKTTNLPWVLDARALGPVVGAPRVELLNDLEAAAYGMLHLEAREFHVLNEGARPPREGNIAVLAAGTGLGEAMLIWDGVRHHAVASEGGHSDFAPRTAQEIELLEFLMTEHGPHVSYERVLSGPGLLNLYRFLREAGGAPEPGWLAQRLRAHEDPSAVVSAVGLEGEDPVCVEALERFAAVYGAEAGNLALKCLALGGVLLGGGIAPKILPVLASGAFMHAFTDKGRYAELLRGIPVKVALNPRAPLLGAAHYANSRAGAA